ncbi:aspartate carbamoyltransferase [Streptomyces sp. CB03238]|uniref:aspartate carbamoyltransferase n=1 Tax=Streptomyces sp. CB03238 TaxID=1907777 RepID=UPI00117E3015|nr:aspartate carbamoyltransferase [Streptomyces sp. CB03238]
MTCRGVRLLVPFVALLSIGCGASPEGAPSRQEQVARNGASVMPFDLERTTHRFTPDADGLVEQVVTDDRGDAGQIRLIREHLADEARRFRQGDYADPARIHGTDMPGLKELAAGAAGIRISYADLPDGAVVRFRTTDPALVDALHRWGAAQTSDHGEHADH